MATDGITVADTMTTGTDGMARMSGSSDINVAPPAILTSIVARPRGGPIAFFKEHVALLSQRASEAAVVAREAVTDAADFNMCMQVLLPSTARCFSNVLLASHLMGRSPSN